MKFVRPYSALARVYDAVMDHVEYDAWADYILHLMDSWDAKEDEAVADENATDGASSERQTSSRSVLELGAGTGLLTLELLDQSDVDMIATDASEDMLRLASSRLEVFPERSRVEVLDFSNGWSAFTGSFDVILLLFDGYNYLLDEKDVAAMLQGVADHLNDGGLFIFDQSTPHNSINNADFFEDEGELEGAEYIRKSSFDDKSNLHTTDFDIQTSEGSFHETHVQRAWTLDETKRLLKSVPLSHVAAYDGFSLDSAQSESDRIHWVLRRNPR